MPTPAANRALTFYTATIRRFALAIVLGVLALSAAATVYVQQNISLNANVAALMSEELPWRQAELAYKKAFPQFDDRLVVVLDGPDRSRTAEAAQALADALRSKPELFPDVRVPGAEEFFKRNGILFLSADDITQITEDLIAAQPILGMIARDPSLHGLFQALSRALDGLARDEFRYAQIAHALNALAGTIQKRLEGRPEPLAWDQLINPKAGGKFGARRFVITQPALNYADLMPGAAASRFIRAEAEKLGLNEKQGFRLRLTGDVAMTDEEFASLKDSAGWGTIITFLLVALLLVLALKNLRMIGPILICLLCGLSLTTAAALALYGALNMISVAFAVLFLGLAVDLSIQLGMRVREQRYHNQDDAAQGLDKALADILPALSLAAGATAAGFLAFGPSDYIGVAQLGIIAGMGMGIAWLLNLTFLPALLWLLRPRPEKSPIGFGFLRPVEKALVQGRSIVLGVCALLAALSVWGCFALRFDGDPINLRDAKSESVSTFLELTGDPLTNPYTIVVLTEGVEGGQSLASAIADLPSVREVRGLFSFVPKDQAEKLLLLDDAGMILLPTLMPSETLPPPRRLDTRAVLAKVIGQLRDIPFAPKEAERLWRILEEVVRSPDAELLTGLESDLVAPLLKQLDDVKLLLRAGRVSANTIPPEIRRDWISADGVARLEIYPKGDMRDPDALETFVREVQTLAPQATGPTVAILEVGKTVTEAFALAGILSCVIIALLLLTVLRRPLDLVRVLLPLFFAAALTLGTFAALGLRLNFANIIALPLLLGIGVSFSIYIVMRWREGHDDLLSSPVARAVLFSAATTSVAFGSLAFSPHPGTASMGLLLSLCLGYTLFTVFVFLPAFLGGAPATPGRALTEEDSEEEK